MRTTTFIYALCEPGTRTVRYIGKADNPRTRLAKHLTIAPKTNNHRGRWLSSLLMQGQRPEVIILREVPVGDWKLAEERYIRLARGLGMDLVNATDGGDGLFNPSPETREKLRQSALGRILSEETRKKCGAANIGRHPSEETRAKLRARKSSTLGKTGELAPFFGRRHSEVTKAKQSLARLGTHPTAETCEKMRVAKLGNTNAKKKRASI